MYKYVLLHTLENMGWKIHRKKKNAFIYDTHATIQHLTMTL